MKCCASALPVVNGHGSIVGMLTEDDLLFRLRDRHPSWWRTIFADAAQLAHQYQRAVGTQVQDVMRPAPVPVDPETSIQSAAERLAHSGTGVVPVLADGRLVGTVSYRDLVTAAAENSAAPEVPYTDDELDAEMRARLTREAWVSNRAIWIAAKNGVITLFGLVGNEEEKTALGLMARTITGCSGVENKLIPRSQLPHRGHWL